jgi:NAD(P)H dehydrogenase (quinone)
MQRALEGTGTLFPVSGHESPERVEHHKTAVDAAVDVGVSRIVYLSFLGAAPVATFTLARQHWATKRHIPKSGLGFTFLRDSLYADALPVVAGSDGVIRGPAGDGDRLPTRCYDSRATDP